MELNQSKTVLNIKYTQGDDIVIVLQFDTCESGVTEPIDISDWIFKAKVKSMAGATLKEYTSAIGGGIVKSASGDITDTVTITMDGEDTVLATWNNAVWDLQSTNDGIRRTWVGGCIQQEKEVTND